MDTKKKSQRSYTAHFEKGKPKNIRNPTKVSTVDNQNKKWSKDHCEWKDNWT